MSCTAHLIRHGLPDWDAATRRGWTGPLVDFAPLSPEGVSQAQRAAETLRDSGATLVVSSPMTRALQTAGVIASGVQVPMLVEFQLHEWLPHKRFHWLDMTDVCAAYDAMLAVAQGTSQAELECESLSEVRARALSALAEHSARHPRIIVVCHEIVIFSLTGQRKTGHATERTLELGGPASSSPCKALDA